MWKFSFWWSLCGKPLSYFLKKLKTNLLWSGEQYSPLLAVLILFTLPDPFSTWRWTTIPPNSYKYKRHSREICWSCLLTELPCCYACGACGGENVNALTDERVPGKLGPGPNSICLVFCHWTYLPNFKDICKRCFVANLQCRKSRVFGANF